MPSQISIASIWRSVRSRCCGFCVIVISRLVGIELMIRVCGHVGIIVLDERFRGRVRILPGGVIGLAFGLGSLCGSAEFLGFGAVGSVVVLDQVDEGR